MEVGLVERALLCTSTDIICSDETVFRSDIVNFVELKLRIPRCFSSL